MTLTKNQRKADSIRRCLTTKRWTRSAACHLIETWNTRWTTSWTPAKIAREERSRLRRLKPEKTTGVLKSYSVWVRAFREELIKNHTEGMKTSRSFRCSESMQRVTTVVSGRSVKCNAIFAVWIFAVVDLLSRVDTSHFQYLGTSC